MFVDPSQGNQFGVPQEPIREPSQQPEQPLPPLDAAYNRMRSSEYLKQNQNEPAVGNKYEEDLDLKQDPRPREEDAVENPNNIDPEAYLPEDEIMARSRVLPQNLKPRPEVDLYEWIAPSRPFKKRTRKFFSTVLIIALLVALILVFIGQLLPVAVVGAVVFVVYVMSVVPPIDTKYKFTTYGLRIENVLYYWEELGRFWYDEKFGQKMVQVELFRFPGRVTLMIGDANEEVIDLIFSEVLLKEKPPLTNIEKIAAWLEKQIPLED